MHRPVTDANQPHNTLSIRALDQSHHMHPFSNQQEIISEGGVRVITRGEGVYLWDSEGEKLLDGMAGLWCVNIGYGRKELADAAARQMEELSYYNTFFRTTTAVAAELAAEIASVSPNNLDRVFYTNSGSEANDTNIRLARLYWKRLGRPERKAIISRQNAYHGSSIGSGSLTGLNFMHDIAGMPIPDVHHAPAPFWWRDGRGQTLEEHCAWALDGLEETIRQVGPENVAAFIGEPVQGSGGVLIPPSGYWQGVQEICRKYDILLICDEVICGFGRTGQWFGSHTYAIEPDIITIAKGLSSGYLPIAASVFGDRVASVLMDKPGHMNHGFTYSGHPVAAAVALENIRILKRERIVERVGEETGPYFQAKLRELLDHPLVGEVRGVGLMAAVELTRDKEGRTPIEPVSSVATPVRNLCFKTGLITRGVRDSLIFSPPLVISKDEIDWLVKRLRDNLDEFTS
ncbi:aminotransferase [Sinorhizobium meliloti]|uniref:aminotransferase n=1 Tax=Rhizobium meliloti TaxID=382 RepID=UPI001296D359|nr:aminotransferase [Sinorhizobium meliloti]MQX41862.1 aminotransferase class III-fold pyridoxal phosphate-dependent enzyme [Sinorhizobium meliloti]MQX55019.1 aminotransferase class III-fold pyridoxal phosphate-dependent enzyme [Sinorhizobium meliloti]